MRKSKIAAIILIIHGGLMEIGGALALLPVIIMGSDSFNIGQYFAFKLPYFQDNLYLMMVMGAIYGIMRVIAAIGILKNQMWGLVLGAILCVVTLCLMMFLLPAGIVDGVLAGSALVLLLCEYFGNRKIA